MGPDQLTPAERDEVQLHFLRTWLGRKRRARFDSDRRAAATKGPANMFCRCRFPRFAFHGNHPRTAVRFCIECKGLEGGRQ